MKKVVIYLLSLLLCIACTNNYGKHSKEVLRVAIGNEPDTLDPGYANDTAATRIVYDLFAGLMDFNQKNEIIPGLAKKFEISADGLTYTFYLRHNLRFSNGLPLTAHDFVYSWKRLVNPKLDFPNANILNNVVNAEGIRSRKLSVDKLGIEAKNNTTFVVHLVHPDINFIKSCAGINLMVVPETVISRYGKSWTHPQHIATSGAYMLKQHVFNGYVLVQKNPYFWDANHVLIDKIKYIPYLDISTGLDAYKSGEVDIADIPLNSTKSLLRKNKKEVYIVPEEGVYSLDFNMKSPIFMNNLKLRQALSMAIDREVLVNDILYQKEEPLYSIVTATIENGKYKNFAYPWSTLSSKDRVIAAQNLYKAAGYSFLNPLYVTINFNNNDLNKKVILAVASMWQNTLGVKVILKSQGFNVFLNDRRNGAFMIARNAWIPDNDTVFSYLETHMCNSPQNYSGYCNKDYDSLLHVASTDVNENDRAVLYGNAIKIAEYDYISIPIFKYTYAKMVKPYVRGYKIEENSFNHVQSKWLDLAN